MRIFFPMTQRSFVCARMNGGASGETEPRCEGCEARNATTRPAHTLDVVGEASLTAIAPALSSPLRKTAPYGLPVHRLGDRAGRSPGSRVVAQLRPAFPVSQWPCGRGLAADSCGGSHGFQPIRKQRTGRFRVPSFVPGITRGTSTLKCSLEPWDESSAVPAMPFYGAEVSLRIY